MQHMSGDPVRWRWGHSRGSFTKAHGTNGTAIVYAQISRMKKASYRNVCGLLDFSQSLCVDHTALVMSIAARYIASCPLDGTAFVWKFTNRVVNARDGTSLHLPVRAQVTPASIVELVEAGTSCCYSGLQIAACVSPEPIMMQQSGEAPIFFHGTVGKTRGTFWKFALLSREALSPGGLWLGLNF